MLDTTETSNLIAAQASDSASVSPFKSEAKWLATIKKPALPATEEEWMAQHPLGFVEYREAMDPKGKYGKWIRQHAAIVIESDVREASSLRFNPRPFDRESIRVQPQAGQQPDIILKTMVVIAGVERRFGEQRRVDVLEHPEVAVEIVPFHLVGGRRGAPQKSRRIFAHYAGLSSLLNHSRRCLRRQPNKKIFRRG